MEPEITTPESAKRIGSYWTLPVIVAIAAVVLLLVGVFARRPDSNPILNSCGLPVVNSNAPRQWTRTATNSSTSTQVDQPSNTGSSPEVEIAGSKANKCVVTLKFVTLERTPAARVRFRFGAVYAVSDDGGKYSFECPRNGAVDVEVCGEPETVTGPNGFKRLETSYSASWCAPVRRIVLNRSDILEEIVVLQAKDIHIQATYEDGVPYEGTFYLHAYLRAYPKIPAHL